MKPRDYRADEIQVRKGQFVGEDKSKVELLLYADARACQEVLDETFGELGWACNYKEEKGILFCGIGVLDPKSGAFIWRWNSGAEQSFEKEKSVASDALKRCAVLHGIGRSLYTAPRIVVPNENKAYKVSEITYEDGKIKDLVITDKFDNVIYSYHNFKQDGGQTATPSPASTPIPPTKDDRPWNVRLQEWCGQQKDATQDTETHNRLLAFYYYYLKKEKKGLQYGVKRCWEFFVSDLHNGKLEIDWSNPRHPQVIEKWR